MRVIKNSAVLDDDKIKALEIRTSIMQIPKRAARVQDQFAPALTLPMPAAYAVPPQWKEVIALLDLHGLKSFRLKQPLSAPFDTYRFDAVTWMRRGGSRRRTAFLLS